MIYFVSTTITLSGITAAASTIWHHARREKRDAIGTTGRLIGRLSRSSAGTATLDVPAAEEPAEKSPSAEYVIETVRR